MLCVIFSQMVNPTGFLCFWFLGWQCTVTRMFDVCNTQQRRCIGLERFGHSPQEGPDNSFGTVASQLRHAGCAYYIGSAPFRNVFFSPAAALFWNGRFAATINYVTFVLVVHITPVPRRFRAAALCFPTGSVVSERSLRSYLSGSHVYPLAVRWA